MKMEGRIGSEVAARLEVGPHTVVRKLKLIRST